MRTDRGRRRFYTSDGWSRRAWWW